MLILHFIIQIAFKMAHKDYLLVSGLVAANVAVGMKVVVNVDEIGEDIGTVDRVFTQADYMREKFNLPYNPQFNVTKYVAGRIVRVATPRECLLCQTKLRDEEEAMTYATHLVNNVHHLDIRLLGAEFQFDRYRLTLYYEANQRVEFRHFVRDLFEAYKSRVWMERVHIPAPTASSSVSTQPQQAPPLGRVHQQQHPHQAVQQGQGQGPGQGQVYASHSSSAPLYFHSHSNNNIRR